MKQLFLSIALCIAVTLNLFAQKEAPPLKPPPMPVNPDTKLIVYEEVVMVEGVKLEELQRRLNDEWFKNFFKNPQGVLQELTNDQMTGKHGFNIYKDVNGQKTNVGVVKYTFKIALKGGKYKYTLSDIFFSQVPKLPIEKWLDESSPAKADNFSYLTQVNEFMKNFTGTLKTAMTVAKKEKKDDW